MTSILTQDEPIDSWENISSDDEVEDLVEEEVSKEVVDPNKEKRESTEKAIRKCYIPYHLVLVGRWPSPPP